MQIVDVAFCGQAYADATPDANAQECVNLYPMRSPAPGNPDRVALYPTPGQFRVAGPRKYADLIPSSDPVVVYEVRGSITINNDLYLVYGPYLTKAADGTIDDDYAVVGLGQLNTAAGLVDIQCNTVELVISDGAYGYTYNLSTGVFSTISGGSFPASGGVTNFAFIDSYMLAAVNGTKRVIQSDLLAGGTYPALAFIEVASFPDNLVAVYSDQNNLYLFGPKLTEVRFNAGSIPFAFEKVPGVLIQAGCAAKHTIKKFGGSFAWLALDDQGTPYVATLRGYTPVPLSTPAINQAIRGYQAISDARAYTYREGDNTFYVITFPTENVTWAVELSTGWWHKRSTNGGAENVTCATYWNNSVYGRGNYVGTTDGGLCLMSQDYGTHPYSRVDAGAISDDDHTITRTRTGPHLWADDQPIFLHELRIDAEGALGTADAEPSASLEISRDGGHTWVGGGIVGMGKAGEYRKRLAWRNLGRALKYTFRLTVTNVRRTYITGASAKITVGRK